MKKIVAIQDFEIPKSCTSCEMRCTAMLKHVNQEHPRFDERLPDCKLIEIEIVEDGNDIIIADLRATVRQLIDSRNDLCNRYNKNYISKEEFYEKLKILDKRIESNNNLIFNLTLRNKNFVLKENHPYIVYFPKIKTFLQKHWQRIVEFAIYAAIITVYVLILFYGAGK